MIKAFFIEKESIDEAWLEALWKVFLYGQDVKTQYDKENDFPSKDATVMIVVHKPFSNPLIAYKKLKNLDIFAHEGDLIGIQSVIGGYLDEIVNGIHDHQIGKGTSFPYTYHDRICNYPNYKPNYRDNYKNINDESIYSTKKETNYNQIKEIIRILKDASYSRRAQGITWQPNIDLNTNDPPCLQRIWARVINGELTFQTDWRSRDLFKAWEANVNGMIQWMKIIADELNVPIGTYVDHSNSLHIYGQEKEFKAVINFFDTLIKKYQNKEKLSLIPIQYLRDYAKLKKKYNL